MGYLAVYGSQGRWVASMVVTKYRGLCLSRQRDSEQLGHVLSYGLWVGTAKLSLELTPPVSLVFGHAALSPQLALGEVDEKVGVLLHRDVVVNGVVLTELEALKPVDDQGAGRGRRFHVAPMKEHTVSAQAGESIVDRLGRDPQVSGDLSVGHPAHRLHEDAEVESRELLPVGHGEGLGAEGSAARFALVTLYTVGCVVAGEKSRPFKCPPLRQRIVEMAVGVGTVRWCPAQGCGCKSSHARGIAHPGPETISEAQPTGNTTRRFRPLLPGTQRKTPVYPW